MLVDVRKPVADAADEDCKSSLHYYFTIYRLTNQCRIPRKSAMTISSYLASRYMFFLPFLLCLWTHLLSPYTAVILWCPSLLLLRRHMLSLCRTWWNSIFLGLYSYDALVLCLLSIYSLFALSNALDFTVEELDDSLIPWWWGSSLASLLIPPCFHLKLTWLLWCTYTSLLRPSKQYSARGVA